MSRLQKLKRIVLRDKNFLLKFFGTALARGVAAVGTFVFNFVLAKYLGSKDFGYFMLGYSIVLGLSAVGNVGMGSAILRFSGIMYNRGEFSKIAFLRNKVYSISFGVTIFLGALFFLSKHYLAIRFFDGRSVESALTMFALSVPFFAVLALQASFFKSFRRPQISPFFEIGLSAFVTGVLVFLGANIGYDIGLLEASVCFFIASVTVAIAGYIVLNKIIVGPAKSQNSVVNKLDEYRDILKSLPDYSLTGITMYLLKFSPTLIMGLYISGEEIGLFSIANSTSFVISFVLWIINSVSSPYFAGYYADNNLPELRRLVRNSTIYMLVLAVPIFLAITIFPSFILSLFGEEYIEAKNGLIILACAQLFNVATGPVYLLLRMTGHQRFLRNVVFLTTIISIISSFLLIPIYGYMGAVYSAAIGLVLQNSGSYYYTNKFIGISIWGRKK